MTLPPKSYIYAPRLVWPGEQTFSRAPENVDWYQDLENAKRHGQLGLGNCPKGTRLVILRREVGAWEEVEL